MQSLDIEVLVVCISDIVAVEVTLNILDQCLEVHIWQLVRKFEHNVLQEFFIELRSAREQSHVASVLRQASVLNHIVLVIRVDNL